MKDLVLEAWQQGSFRMEVWMTAATAQHLLFMPDPDLLVCGEMDGTVRILDETTRGVLSQLKAHQGAVTGLANIGASIVSTGEDGRVCVWSQQEGKREFSAAGESEGHGGHSVRLLIPASATSVLSAGSDGSLATWSLTEAAEDEGTLLTLQTRYVVAEDTSPIRFAAIHEGQVVSVSDNGTVRFWRAGGELAGVEGREGLDPVSCCVCRDGVLAVGTTGGRVELWDVDSHALLHSIQLHNKHTVLCVEICQGTLLSSGEDGKINFTSVESGRKITGFSPESPATSLALRMENGSNGLRPIKKSSLIISGHADGMAMLWNSRNHSRLHKMDGHFKAVRGVHANRCCAVTAGDDNTARVWRFADQYVLGQEEEERQHNVRKATELKEEGNEHYRAKRFGKAVRCYSEAMELEPDNFIHVLNRAAACLHGGKLEQCVSDADVVLAMADEHADDHAVSDAHRAKALGRKGSALMRLERHEEARATLEAAYALSADAEYRTAIDQLVRTREVKVDREAGTTAFRKGDHQLALTHFMRCAEGEPEDMRHHNNVAAALLKLNRLEECVASCDRALECDGAEALRAKALGRKGKALHQMGKDKEAVEFLDQSLALQDDREVSALRAAVVDERKRAENPNWELEERQREREEALLDKERGNEMYKAKKYSHAVKFYSKAAERQPNDPVFLTNRAAAWLAMDNNDMCIADCRSALALTTRCASDDAFVKRIHLREAAALTRQAEETKTQSTDAQARKWSAAAQALERAMALAPDDTTAAKLAAARGMAQQVTDMDKAKEDRANGDHMFMDGNFEEAIKYYDKAAAYDPMGKSDGAYLLYSNRAACNSQLGNDTQALVDVEKCLKINPTYADGWNLKSTVLTKKGRKRDATAATLEAFWADPGNKHTHEALKADLVEALTQMLKEEAPSSVGNMSDRLGAAQNHPKVQTVLQDQDVLRTINEMQVKRTVEPVMGRLEDKVFVGKFMQLFHCGVLFRPPADGQPN